MTIIYAQLLGGIGNIFFIVATLYALALDRNMDFCISHNTLSITPRKKEEKIWMEDVLRSVKKVSSPPPESMQHIYNQTKYRYKEIPKYEKGFQIRGYFQCAKFFDHQKEKIIKLFTEYKDKISDSLSKKILGIDMSKTISIHVRRTDYVKLQRNHVLQPEHYYRKALQTMTKKLKYPSLNAMNKDYKILIFSDDFVWCKKAKVFRQLKNIKWMEHNSSMEDLYIMSMCHHNIIANSSFSWWGSYLNIHEDKIIVAPQKWFNPRRHQPWDTVYTNDMIVLS